MVRGKSNNKSLSILINNQTSDTNKEIKVILSKVYSACKNAKRDENGVKIPPTIECIAAQHVCKVSLDGVAEKLRVAVDGGYVLNNNRGYELTIKGEGILNPGYSKSGPRKRDSFSHLIRSTKLTKIALGIADPNRKTDNHY